MPVSRKIVVSQAAKDLHTHCAVIDLHGDTFLWARKLGYDIAKRHRNVFPRAPFAFHIDLPRMREACVDGQIFGVVVNPILPAFSRYRETMMMLACMHDNAVKLSRKMGFASNADELNSLRKDGKIAGMIGVEGAHCLGGRLGAIEECRKAGVVYISLAHLSNNEACTTQKDLKHLDRGLMPFGFECVEEMERLGIIFDMAHINEGGFFEVMTHRKKKLPVIASHTGIKGAHYHWRNLSDDQVRAIADSDGTIGIMFHSRFISKSTFATLDDLVAHFIYVKKLVGARHLSYGSDFDGFIIMPKDIHGVEDLPLLTQALLDAGFTEDEMIGILGGNFMRVFDAVCG